MRLATRCTTNQSVVFETDVTNDLVQPVAHLVTEDVLYQEPQVHRMAAQRFRDRVNLARAQVRGLGTACAKAAAGPAYPPNGSIRGS